MSIIWDLYDSIISECDTEYIILLFRKALIDDSHEAIKLMFYVRDIGNGLGKRDMGCLLMKELKKEKPKIYMKNLFYFCNTYGCFRDLFKLMDNNMIMELNFLRFTLECDLDELKNGGYITQASKWAPSEGGKYDIIAKRLAGLMFPNDCRSMQSYRKKVLTPLRNRLNIVETKITMGKWDEIEMNKVPRLAKEKYKKVFEQKHINNLFNRDNWTQTNLIESEHDLHKHLLKYIYVD